MAKILRKNMKIFGASAGFQELVEFGSYAAGAAAYTTDPETIQSLSNYDEGWFGGVVGENSPAMEDMNSLCYLFAYQLAYLMQAGVAEWNSLTTYYTNSIVESGGVLYSSLTDTNLNNAVTDNTKWRLLRTTVTTFASPTVVGGVTPIPVSTGGDQDIYVGTTPSWVAETASEANTWSDIVWAPSLNLFVAIATTGTHEVMTSPDGITWTNRTAAASKAYTSLCWSPELSLFVAVAPDAAGGNQVMTSPDAITWTTRTASSDAQWESVCWAPGIGLFVAVAGQIAGGTKYVMTSPDGTTWTDRTQSEGNAWLGVCWSADLNLLVAVASSGTHRVMTSPDGTTWTNRTASEANSWVDVCWSSKLGLFAAVAGNGTHQVMTSPDGITWTNRTAPEVDGFTAIIFAEEVGYFVAVAASGTNRTMYSADGITWTALAAAEANVWDGIAWSPSLYTFAAVSQGGTHRVMILAPKTISATPQIQAGTTQGQRLSVIGGKSLVPAKVVTGNGVYTPSTFYSQQNNIGKFLWDNAQALWLRA